MKKLLLLTTLLFFSNFSISKTMNKNVILPSDDAPWELQILFKSLQKNSLSNHHHNIMKKSILILDKLIPYLSKEEFFFIAKTEIYKSLLLQKEFLPFQVRNERYPRYPQIVVSRFPLPSLYVSSLDERYHQMNPRTDRALPERNSRELYSANPF